MNNLYRRDGWVKGTLGPAIPGAQIWVCSQPANTDFLPPVPLVSVFSDPAGLVPVTQPIITDGFGHYDYYVAPGLYTEIVAFGGKVQKVYPDQSLGNVGTAGTTALVLSTNGTPNFNQALQNLVQGAGIAIVTDNFGNTTITGSAIPTPPPPTMTNTVGGLVPTPPNDATQFLNGAGVFSTPAGGGGGGLQSGSITLTATQLRAMSTAMSGVDIVPGVPGKYCIMLQAIAFNGAYTVLFGAGSILVESGGGGFFTWGQLNSPGVNGGNQFNQCSSPSGSGITEPSDILGTGLSLWPMSYATVGADVSVTITVLYQYV